MEDNRFTNREIQLMFDKVNETLLRIENYIRDEHAGIKKEIGELESRVTHLEAFQIKAMTAWAFVVTLVGYLLNKFL